jgi:hypothetical protein
MRPSNINPAPDAWREDSDTGSRQTTFLGGAATPGGAGDDDSEITPQQMGFSAGQRTRQTRDQLYREATENPNSEATEIVKALLFEGIVRSGADPYEEEHWNAFSAERVRLDAARQSAKPTAAGRQGEPEQFGQSPNREIAQLRGHLDEISQAAEAARAAMEAGTPMDHMAVYNRIAEVIGLRPQPYEQGSPGAASREEAQPASRPEAVGHSEP